MTTGAPILRNPRIDYLDDLDVQKNIIKRKVS